MTDKDCLDVLSCLLDNGRLSVDELVSRIGGPPLAVRGVVRLLEAYGLVHWLYLRFPEEVYEATLLIHPDWVREAIEDHRAAQEFDSK